MSRSTSAAGPLLLRMFGGRSKQGRQGNLLQHAEHVLKSGYVQEPLWLDALRLCVLAHGGAGARAVPRALTRDRAQLSSADVLPGSSPP